MQLAQLLLSHLLYSSSLVDLPNACSVGMQSSVRQTTDRQRLDDWHWAQLTKTVRTARFGLEFVALVFWCCIIYLYVRVGVLFYLGQLSHLPSCFGTGITNSRTDTQTIKIGLHKMILKLYSSNVAI